MEYYKQSLAMADRAICEKKLTGKALKDIVGKEYENHRKRIWEHFGFSVTKDKHNACFSVDWTIKNKKGEIVAFEEDKGHYLDSCFMERAFAGFAKTINSYAKNDTKIPLLLIHSFTKYSKFEEKKLEDIETRKEFIADVMRTHIHYSTLTHKDRLPAAKWFKNCDDCYIENANDELILKDIEFILSLQSQ